MAQSDPFAKWKSKEVKEDPFVKWKSNREVEDTKIETKSKEEEVKTKENKGVMSSIGDWLTTSYLPEMKMNKPGLDSSDSPFMFPIRAAGEMASGAYEDLIRPMGSPLGAALTIAGGPIARGVVKGASLIPGASKVASLLGREVIGGEAPAFVKGIVNELTPKPKMSTPVVTPPVVPEPLAKFRVALEESKPLSKEQAKLLSVERGAKFASADKVDVVDSNSANLFSSKFKGEHTKLVNEGLKLEQPDIDGLMKMIGENHKAGKLSTPETKQSIDAFNGLLEGRALQKNEIETLSRTFGGDVMASAARASSPRDWLMQNISIPKALFSAADVGWPLRQGINRAGTMNWNKAVWDSLKAYTSESRSQELLDGLKQLPRFDFWRTHGLEIYDNVKTTGIEHSLNSRVQNFLPVKMGNRAFNTGISKLRLTDANDLFNDYDVMYKSALDLAKSNPNKAVSEKLIREAEIHNPNNEYVAKKIADLVNTGTGYGNIGKLKAIAEETNALIFSPALMSARFKSIHRVLNPLSYINKDPVQRKYALKQLLSLTGAVVSLGTALKSAGAEVELDPRSSDFLTAKFGKTRVDLTGGYRSYFVAPSKIISGVSKSTKTGNENELNSGKFGGQTKFDVLETFAIGKEAPVASLVTSYLRGIKPSGEPVDFTNKNPMENTAAQAAIPGILQTLYEISEEDPQLLPLMGLSSMGANVSVYQDKNKTPFSNRVGRR